MTEWPNHRRTETFRRIEQELFEERRAKRAARWAKIKTWFRWSR